MYTVLYSSTADIVGWASQFDEDNSLSVSTLLTLGRILFLSISLAVSYFARRIMAGPSLRSRIGKLGV